MNNLKEKKILIFQQRGWAKAIGNPLAKKLQDCGCELAALTLKRSTHEFITKKQKEVSYKYVVSVDDIYEDPEKILNGENITLEQICKDLNIDSVWPMLNGDRLLTKSYRKKFYYSYRQNVSDEFIINFIKALYKVIRDIFTEFKPDAVFVAFFGFEGHILLNLFANKYNIPTIGVSDSKIKGTYIFVDRYQNDAGSFYDRIDELNNGSISENRERAKKYINEFREKFKKPDEFDVIFADPPYYDEQLSTVTKIMGLLKARGYMILSHTGRSDVEINSGIVVVDNRSYANAHITFYHREA